MEDTYIADDLLMALDFAADHVKALSYTPPATRTVMVLAAAVTHVTKAFGHLPRIMITGEYGCGKSTLLDAVQPLVQNPVRNAGQLSSTFAYRNDFRDKHLDGNVPTTMVDETKHIFGLTGKSGSGHPLYAILTEGYSKTGAPIKYQEKDVNVPYSCYQIAITASKGLALPEDVQDRAIILAMAKKPKGMSLESATDPAAAGRGEDAGKFLRAAVQATFPLLKVVARDTDWYAKYKLDSRVADKWIPLFTIADVAGGMWPELVQAAYAELGSKTSRSLPAPLQVKADVIGFLAQSPDPDPEWMPARDLITYLQELGRACYKWDDDPFTLKRFGMTLKAAGVQVHKSHSVAYYRVPNEWLKAADRIANPPQTTVEDPENDWACLDDFIED